ncbi:MAG: hypothetical protein Q9225_004222 [Loekoesia sp. 1 TL-2023]
MTIERFKDRQSIIGLREGRVERSNGVRGRLSQKALVADCRAVQSLRAVSAPLPSATLKATLIPDVVLTLAPKEGPVVSCLNIDRELPTPSVLQHKLVRLRARKGSSIMSQHIPDDSDGIAGLPIPDGARGEALRFEEPVKLKGRKRFLQNLQRISSSPSLARMGRVPSSGYRTGGKASMSCVSLASSSSTYGHSHGNSYSSQTSVGFSTAPTSVVTTPGPEAQTFDLKSRIRIVSASPAGQPASTPLSVPLPADLRSASKETQLPVTPKVANINVDYFSKPVLQTVSERKQRNLDFWEEMPYEIRIHILQYLEPWEIVRCSAVSKSWQKMCFDGQLWTQIETHEYYRDISSTSLVRIMTAAGPFVRDLNLRGCVQLWERWTTHGQAIFDACRNLQYFSLEGCRIDRSSVHHFLLRNTRLVHINFCGVQAVNNSAMKIVAQGCPQLEFLDVSWCNHLDTQGLHKVIQSCLKLKELKASETRGWNDKAFVLDLFKKNTLERLVIAHSDIDDEGLEMLLQGVDPEIDPLTDRAIVPPRKFRHINFSRCHQLTDKGIKCLAHNVPQLAGLQVSHILSLTDDAFQHLFEDTPLLTHLDMEEIEDITNSTLQNLAQSPCATILKHLNVSYCENLGDTGMLPLIKACPDLRTIHMDNTRVSDLVLTEAAAQIRVRDQQAPTPPLRDPNGRPRRPKVALHLIVYDCQNVTWTGIREIMSRNTEPNRDLIISLKCFYGYQDTVNEHMKRVKLGRLDSAQRLERKWAEYMIASEEAGAGGAGARRRRRRAREAAMVHADEEEGGPRGGRRRARSGGCVVM